MEAGIDGCRPSGSGIKAQSAMEYLMTYGWAVLIISVVLGVLYGLNIFNLPTFSPNTCVLEGDFSCSNTTLSSTGVLALTVGQSTSSQIYVTAIGCNSIASTAGMTTFNTPVFLPTGSNFTTSLQCYSRGAPFSASIGTQYAGYLLLNYTNINTGFSQTITGALSQKVTKK
jgi:hypothetical protein